MLTEDKIKREIPGETQKKLSDGDGLLLLVMPGKDGAKLWRLRYKFDGREQMLSLGSWSKGVTLRMARDKARKARDLLATGVNPSDVRKAEKNDAVTTVKSVCEAWHQYTYRGSATWHARDIRNRLARYIYPTLGNKPIKSVTSADLTRCLEVMVTVNKAHTAYILQQNLRNVWKWACGRGDATINVATYLDFKIPPTKKHPGITDPMRFGHLLRDMDGYHGRPETVFLLKLMPYLFQRTGELRQAEWREFDLENAMWTIPAARMKVGKTTRPPHLVPLAHQVVDILRRLHVLTGHYRLAFPGQRDVNTPASRNIVRSALRTLGWDTGNEHSGHGFRTSASTMLSKMRVPKDVRETQLAHAIPGIEGDYNEDDTIELRIPMMQLWADAVDQMRATFPEDHGRPAARSLTYSSISDSSQRTLTSPSTLRGRGNVPRLISR